MSEIRWKLAEYLKIRGVTADKLAATIADPDKAEIVYRLVENPAEQRQLDLSDLAAIMESLILLIDCPINVAEILEFVPHLPEEFVEKSEWKNVYLYGDLDPYDWGDVDPLEGTKPVRYIPGIGMVVDDEEVAPTNRENIKEFTRITFNPVMGETPCIRNLPIAVETVIAMIASHYSVAEICKKYPDLEEEDINEALAYAAWRIEETKSPKKGDREVEKVCE